MSRAFPACVRGQRRSGIALIAVLLLVSILSVLLISLMVVSREDFVSTQNYSESIRAQELAMEGVGNIVSDLRSEIIAGSTAVGTAYVPTVNLNMVPVSTIPATNPVTPNLIRMSTSTAASYATYFPSTRYTFTGTFPINVASAAASTSNSTTPSLNGRYISVARWEKPKLFTSASTDPFNTTPPQWVLVTRGGVKSFSNADLPTLRNRTPGNSNYALGRYAFAIYDTSGLLDVNVAGYPTSAAANDIGRKGDEGFADLTQLPGDGKFLGDYPSLISWRNPVSAATMSSYINYLTGYAPLHGFLYAAPGDRAFVGRQDLLNYWTSQLGADATELNLLQYFTTFSREKNAPSWGPALDAGAMGGQNNGVGTTVGNLGTTINNEYAYHTNENSTTAINRLFPGVQVKAAFTRLNGKKAVVGEPLVANRFDLSKLAWITHNGAPPAGITAGDIYNFFGLTLAADGSWTYNHGAPGNGTRIMTLDEVATANREPDFFELLQAGILQGSLGLCSGDPTQVGTYKGGEFFGVNDPTTQTARFPMLSGADSAGSVVSAQEMYQVMQIGANLVDAADTDDYPTDVSLNGQHFYGVENLPYINAVADTPWRPESGGNATALPAGTTTLQAFVHRWLTMSLWNPHQNATSPSATRPRYIRVCATSGAELPWVFNITGNPLSSNCAGYQFAAPGTALSASGSYTVGPSWVEVDLTDFYYNNFAEPMAIAYGHANVTDTQGGTNANKYGLVQSKLGWSKAGIYMGYSYSPDINPKCPGCPTYLNVDNETTTKPYPIFFGGETYDSTMMTFALGANGKPQTITLELQYLDPSTGAWHTYQKLAGLSYVRNSAGDPYMEPSDAGWANWSATPGVNMKNTFVTPNVTKTLYVWEGSKGPTFVPNGEGLVAGMVDPRSTRANMQFLWSDLLGVNMYTDGHSNQLQYTDVGPHFPKMVDSSVGTTVYVYDKPWNWSDNNPTANSTSYYSDRDYVIRDGDAAGWSNANPQIAGNTAARPLIQDRPFQSVGEMGYVFRDDPWRTLDLFSSKSADAALLDIFCVGNNSTTTTITNQPAPSVVAGKLNINTASQPVLQALISGAVRTYNLANPLTVNTTVSSTSDIQAMALGIVNYIKANGPLLNPSQLVSTLPVESTTSTQFPGNKQQREAIIRALQDSSQTRTWNLMIDIVAQSGKYPSTATSLDNFVVDGERRYWLHLAIDRYTGEIVDEQLEPVFE